MHDNKTVPTPVMQIRLSDFSQLTKFRLSISVVISSIAGYFLAIDNPDFITLLLLIFGGYATVGASNAFNQVIEKEEDTKMERTQNRPLPAERMHPTTGLFIGVILTLVGISALYFINLKTAFFASVSIFLYTCLYTPLKKKTPLSVFVGAFPGAIPFMLGWVAATNEFGIEPGVLFMIQFFWQFPHFWAIGWLMNDQYQKAGFKMLPSGAPDQSTAFQIVFYTLWTLVISLVPVFYETGSFVLSYYAALGVGLLGLIFLFFSLRLMYYKSQTAAKQLLRISILYITGIQMIYVIDKMVML